MHQTKLIEFKNQESNLLRGILLMNEHNPSVVLMCGGFERAATTEKKFKVLADELAKNNISSLRFDCAGCGLSDGDFSNVTVKRMADDLQSAVILLKKEIKTRNIYLVCHSLAACAAGILLNDINFEKIVLLAPALNQKNLLRYWFTVSVMEKQNLDIEISWINFKNYLDEEQFQKDCLRTDKTTKANYIFPDYFLENKDKDYSSYFKNNQNILHIHGDSDDKVPLEGLNIKFKNEIIIRNGDHDLERPDTFKQWINSAIDFIK